MASVQKTPKGWRAQIKKLGVRDSKLFKFKREAVDWATARELEIEHQHTTPPAQLYTLRYTLRKYSQEIAVKKRGAHWEQIRIAAFERDLLPLDYRLADVTSIHINDFKNDRLKHVSPGTVIRELTILSAVFTAVIKEWGWIKDNPCKLVTRPPEPKHRERTIHWREIKAMLRAMDYSTAPESITQSIAVCFLVALSTGMRAGELTGLTWDRVFDKHVYLDKTKNDNARNVPLSKRARRYIDYMRGFDDKLVFGVSSEVLSTLFRRHRARAGLAGFTFHDARHTAATLLARKVDVLTLCKIMGWGNPKMAMVYFNPSADSIADLLG